MPAPRPMLRLSVREITSVSATFILSSRLDSPTDPSLSSLGLSSKSNNEEATDNPTTTLKTPKISREPPRSPSPPMIPPPSLIADALSKGLSVTVNGSAWPRTFIRIDEQFDEAVIIIYALMPGRQYDIELGLVSCQNNHNGHAQTEQEQQEQAIGDPTLRRQIVTQENENDPNSPTFEDQSTPSSSSSSLLSSPSSSTPPTSASFITPPPSQPPPTTPPPQPTLTLTERLSQLHQSLTHLTAERDTLLTSLKSLRRESQKADASLRAEIDTLKRTFEKNASFELRSKQKLLALQESVKRAQNAARESEEMKREVEREISELTKRKEENENEHRRMEDEAGRVGRERGEEEGKERKRVEAMRGELNGLTNKLERLNGKRERMEVVVIPDLEAKVQDIEGVIEDAEREVARLEKEEHIRLQFEDTYLPYHHHQQQQPPEPLWAPPASSRPSRSHNPRSHSIHSTTVVYPPPHPRPSLKTSTKSTSMSMMSTSMTQPLLTDKPLHTSPISPNSPGTLKASNRTADPLAVGAGRPSRRSFETTPNRPHWDEIKPTQRIADGKKFIDY